MHHIYIYTYIYINVLGTPTWCSVQNRRFIVLVGFLNELSPTGWQQSARYWMVVTVDYSPLSSTKRDFDHFERCWTLLNWIQLAPEMAYREWTGRTLGGSGDIDIFRFRTQIIAWKLPPSERETLIKPEASIMWGATTSKGISLKDAIWSGHTSGFKDVCKTTALLAKLPSFFPLKTLVITSNHISLGWLREVLDETMCFTPNREYPADKTPSTKFWEQYPWSVIIAYIIR